MKYLSSSPNRLFFLFILLVAMIAMCTDTNLLLAIGQKLMSTLGQSPG